MPTPLDRAMHSKSAVLGFASLVVGAAMWAIWSGEDMFPKEAQPTGDPDFWSDRDLRRWLSHRNLLFTGKETREELVAKVKANLSVDELVI